MPAACVHCGLPVPAARGQNRFCCFGCRFAHELAKPGTTADAPRASTLLLRLGLGVFLTMNLMVFNWFFYARESFGGSSAEHDALAGLFAYLLLFLAATVVALLGLPLAADALARRRLDANLLIVIGVSAAFCLSVANTVNGHYRGLYYDTTVMILLLVTLGNYLDALAKRRAAAAADDLLAKAPAAVWVRRGDMFVETESVQPGDVVRIRPGEIIGVDGQVCEGESHVSEATLTGESLPRAVGTGDRVMAGTVSVDGQLLVRATHAGDDRVVARLRKLVAQARLQQPPIQRLADRVAAVFIPGVVALALAVFAFHAWRGSATVGLFDSLSVLLISCPCALGLAAPLASWNALARAARRGILIDSAPTLQRAASVKHVFFDKTGTLTDPTLRVESVGVSAGDERDALRLAAAVESASLHPIARAIVHEASRRGVTAPPPATHAAALPGLGAAATVEGRTLHLGSARLMERLGLPHERDDSRCIRVYLADGSRVLAWLDLAEQPRPDADETLAALRRMGVGASVLTGDREGPAQRLATLLNVHVESGLLPADKLDRLQETRRHVRAAAMVGDGVNDAPVLAAADVGFALGAGADLAKQAGNVRLLSDRLTDVPATLAIARHAMRRIRLNLAWAFSYNTVGLALAAFGLLTPVLAALAMFASSLLVIRNSAGAGNVKFQDL